MPGRPLKRPALEKMKATFQFFEPAMSDPLKAGWSQHKPPGALCVPGFKRKVRYE